ncbi:efflux RND transporter periplasmic adaptor subunit [Patescibacteria group bacterium]|nr:efflux RND transporter periplasmic adaptor subunit [Patescibacteria group bacterium]
MLEKIYVVILSALVFASVFLFSGCVPKDEVIAEKPIPQVEVMDLSETPEYIISEVATIKATQQIEIISEAAGTINQLSAYLGKTVSANELLAVIDYGDVNNIAQINLDTALSQLANAQQNLDEAKANNQDAVQQAEISVENLESTLEKLERNLEELKVTNESSLNTMQLAVDNTKTSTDTAQVTYDDILGQFEQSWEDYYDSAESYLDAVLVNANSYYRFATDILNPDSVTTVTTQSLPSTLGVYDSAQKNNVVNSYNDILGIVESAESTYESNLPLNEDNIDEVLDEVGDMVSNMRSFIGEMRVLLDNSIAGGNLSEVTLSSYTTSVIAYESTVLGDINTVNTLSQNYQSLQLSETTQTATASNNLIVANNQLTDAENTLGQFEITSESSVKDLENQIEQTEKQLESAETNLDSAMRSRDIANNAKELEIKTLENQVRLAQESLENNRITTSISGMVSELYVDEGDYVTPGMLIAEVIQHKQIKVVFYVSKDIANKLSVNHPITFKVSDNGGHTFSGVISKISPSVDQLTKKIKIEALASNEDLSLRSGMFANIAVDVSGQTFEDGGIYIPLNSVIVGQNEQFVFIVEEGIAVRKDVEMGDIFDKWVEITEGLTKADALVTEGHRNLQEGEIVQF